MGTRDDRWERGSRKHREAERSWSTTAASALVLCGAAVGDRPCLRAWVATNTRGWPDTVEEEMVVVEVVEVVVVVIGVGGG